jgi:hypothetical protein
MKPKFKEVLEMAIQEGISYGYRRSHKHVDHPSEGAIIDNITEGVMHTLHEWFDFYEDKE